jgi:hypothetical protein
VNWKFPAIYALAKQYSTRVPSELRSKRMTP